MYDRTTQIGSRWGEKRFEGESCKTTAERSELRNCYLCPLHRSRDLKSMRHYRPVM